MVTHLPKLVSKEAPKYKIVAISHKPVYGRDNINIASNYCLHFVEKLLDFVMLGLM